MQLREDTLARTPRAGEAIADAQAHLRDRRQARCARAVEIEQHVRLGQARKHRARVR